MANGILAVNPGDPITAQWANRIARHDHGHYIPIVDTPIMPSPQGSMLVTNDPTAWLCVWDGLAWCMQPGSIFVNGTLLSGERPPTGVSSLACSASGFSEVYRSNSGSPSWFLHGNIFLDDEGNVDFERTSFAISAGAADFQGWRIVEEDISSTDEKGDETTEKKQVGWEYETQICESDGSTLTQYLCGALWLTTPTKDTHISLTAGDGIRIDDEEPNKIHLNLSILAGDGISIEEKEPDADADDPNTKTIVISANLPPELSIIAGDGIRVTEVETTDTSPTGATIVVKKETKIALNLSFVADDGIEVSETTNEENMRVVSIRLASNPDRVKVVGGQGITVDEQTDADGTTYTVHNDFTPTPGDGISFVEGDGITIYESWGAGGAGHAVRISINPSITPSDKITFDPDYFVETNLGGSRQVTLRTDVLDEIAREVADEMTIEGEVTGNIESNDFGTLHFRTPIALAANNTTMTTNLGYNLT